jgi:hypothetical protein
VDVTEQVCPRPRAAPAPASPPHYARNAAPAIWAASSAALTAGRGGAARLQELAELTRDLDNWRLKAAAEENRADQGWSKAKEAASRLDKEVTSLRQVEDRLHIAKHAAETSNGRVEEAKQVRSLKRWP